MTKWFLEQLNNRIDLGKLLIILLDQKPRNFNAGQFGLLLLFIHELIKLSS